MKNLFPLEITNPINGMNDELRQGILSLLILKEKASYSTIRDTISASNGNLNHHLNLLIASSLIIKTLEKEHEKTNSYYRISSYGKQFINSLFSALKPRPTSSLKTLIPQYEQEQEQEIGSTILSKTQMIKHYKKSSNVLTKLKQTEQLGQKQSLSISDPIMSNQ